MVTNDVSPAIRKFGEYKMEQKFTNQINDINEKLKIFKNENITLREHNSRLQNKVDVLLNNQGKKDYPSGCIVYALREMDSQKNVYIRIGKTCNIKKRLAVHNSSHPNDLGLIYYLTVDNADRVENCIRLGLYPYIYRHRKDHYDCDLDTIKIIFNYCNNFINAVSACKDCDRKLSGKDLIVSNIDEILKDNNLKLDFEFDSKLDPESNLELLDSKSYSKSDSNSNLYLDSDSGSDIVLTDYNTDKHYGKLK